MSTAEIHLLELLACPDCGSALRRDLAGLRCTGCDIDHPIRAGTPFLLPKHERELEIEHERELEVRSTYPAAVKHMLDAWGRDQILLDIGSGERETDDPRVVLTDLRFTPRVDVVSDAHFLPFADNTVDMVIAGAVFEHLSDPHTAAREIWRVLKPGGQVVADCSFVFPFHGFPASFFHASAEGMKRLFADFTTVTVEVPPWLMPSQSLQLILENWLLRCKPRTEHDRKFLEAIRGLGRFDASALDACFSQEDALRIAAGTCYFGLKQPGGNETVLPEPAMELWRRDESLQRRFPAPAVLLPTLRDDDAPTYLRWVASEGRARDPAIARWYDERPTLRKEVLPLPGP